MKKSNELYEELNLLSKKSFVRMTLTNEPGGELDVPAYLDGEDACWQKLSQTKTEQKKQSS